MKKKYNFNNKNKINKITNKWKIIQIKEKEQ